MQIFITGFQLWHNILSTILQMQVKNVIITAESEYPFMKNNQIDIKEGTSSSPADYYQRRKMVDFLSILLANTYVLAIKTYSSRDSIRRRASDDLNTIVKEQYNDLIKATGQLIKRIRSLGYEVPDSFSHVQKLSEISYEDYSKTSVVIDLMNSNENIAHLIRNQIPLISASEDRSSYGLLKRRLNRHERNAWELKKIYVR